MTQFKKNTPSPYPWDIIALLSVLTLLLIAFQYITLTKFSALPPARHFITLSNFIDAIAYFEIHLNSWDAILSALILITCLTLLILEIVWQRITHFFTYIFASNRRTWIFLGISSLVCVRFYFAPGASSWAADTSLHTTYAWVASQTFAQWEWPVWSNYFTAGSPYLQFYGFLFFYLTGCVDQLIQNHFTSVKLILALGHIISGIGMYAYICTYTRSRQAGFIAGLSYVLCFWHTQQVLIMGRLPLSVFYALLPWPFYAFERLRFRKHRDLHALLGALTLSGLAFTHPGYAFWATAFFAIYITIRRIQSPLPLPHILLLFGGGIILGAYLTLPMWIEKNATGLYIGFAMTHVQDPNWQQLLYWSNHRFALFATEATHQTWYGGYMGLSLTLLALVGLITPVLPGHRHLRHPAIPLCFFGALLLVFGYRWPILRSLTVVQALNSGRYLLFVAFFMCALAGITTAYLTHIRWHRTRTFTIILLIIIIDLFPTTFQHPYLPDKGNDPDLISLSHTQHQTLNQANADLPKSQLPSYRTFYTVSHTYPAVVTGWMINNLRQPSIYALYNERPLAGPALTDPFAAYANERLVNMPDPAALMRHPDWQTILRGFYLLNIQYVVITQEQDAHTWQMPTATPIVVSGRAHPISDQTTDPQFIPLPELLHAYGDIDESARRCDQIPILNHEDNLATQPSVQVLEHQVWNQRMVLRVNISQDCYARLAYAHYPYTNVYVNGKQTIPLKTTDYFIALKLKAGQHTIELVPSLSPLRKGLLTLNIVLLSVAIYFIWRRSKPIKQE